MRDNESGVSWQSGTAEAEEDSILGIEYHFFGNGAASVRLGNRDAQSRVCVVSGFSSKLEQDVLHFLLKGSQPIIIVLARKMYKVIPDELKEPLAQNRLLIISVSTAIRQSRVTAMARNKYVCEMADRILFVGVTEQSSLHSYKNEFRNKLEESI